MSKNKYLLALVYASCLIFGVENAQSQVLSLDSVLQMVSTNNPQLKMYDADILSMDAAASGAKNWMAPQLSTGFFMTPYNTKMWKQDGEFFGMGNYMLGVTQMIPNPKKLHADFNYMKAMSSVEMENKNYTVNQLNALTKTNYYEWLVLNKKVKIAGQNLLLLAYMIKSIEIRYQYNMDKLPSYYKAKSQYNALESMVVMLHNDIAQRRIVLNTMMARDKNLLFEIDSTYQLNDYAVNIADTSALSNDRSDVKAIENTIALNQLKIEAEKAKFLPEFGVKYDHMFAFGAQPQQFSLMGMVTIPMPWSTKMNKANISSFEMKNKSLYWQKQMIINEATGMISGMNTELTSLKKQYAITQKSILPALKRNYDAAILSWQNNTGDLFDALDAWEALNMAQMEALDKLQAMLNAQVEIERQLETK